MMRFVRCTAVLLSISGALALAGTAAPWLDCSPETDGQADQLQPGPFPVVVENDARVAGTPAFPTYRPANLTVTDKWPVYVFMHGSGSDDRFLSLSLKRWASHGIIVVAPYMGIEHACTSFVTDGKCSDKSPDGRYIQDAFAWLKQQDADPTSPLHARLNMQQVAVGGWSMGGVSTIRAVAAMPAGTVSAVLLDSASVADCAFFYNYSQASVRADYIEARRRTSGTTPAPWFFYTSSNDLLHKPNLKLFNNATGTDSASVFAQYKTKYCRDRPLFLNTTIWGLEWATGDFDGFKGHFCAGTYTMTAWATSFLKLVLQQQSNTSSQCHGMIWRNRTDSIANDTRMDDVYRMGA
eukprot:g2092.t1